jgi:ABC-type lipoprotein export system ATPase subunit
MGGSSVQTVGLRREFRVGTETIAALDGLDLTVTPGEFVAVMGPSGSGKSTLLHLIGGLDRPTDGEVWVDGIELGRCPEREQIRHRRECVGFVFQCFHLLPTRSALENVEVAMMLAGVAPGERRGRARSLLEQVGLGHRLSHHPSQLSAGEQQRVAIARALGNGPSLILADEPTGNLDSRTGQDVMSILERLHREQQVTLVVVTHDPTIASYAGRVLHLLDGRFVEEEEGA